MAVGRYSNDIFDLFLQENPSALGQPLSYTDEFGNPGNLADPNDPNYDPDIWKGSAYQDKMDPAHSGDYYDYFRVASQPGVSEDWRRADSALGALRELQHYFGVTQPQSYAELTYNVPTPVSADQGTYDEELNKFWQPSEVQSTLEAYFLGNADPSAEISEGVQQHRDDAFIQMRQNLASRGLVGPTWNEWINRELAREQELGYDDAAQAATQDYESQVSTGAQDMFTQAGNYLDLPGGLTQDIERFAWGDQASLDAWQADTESPHQAGLYAANQNINDMFAQGVDASVNPNLLNIFTDIIGNFPRATTLKKNASPATVPEDWLNTDISSYFVAGGQGTPAQKEHKGTVT